MQLRHGELCILDSYILQVRGIDHPASDANLRQNFVTAHCVQGEGVVYLDLVARDEGQRPQRGINCYNPMSNELP